MEWHLIFVLFWSILSLRKIVIGFWFKTIQVLMLSYSENGIWFSSKCDLFYDSLKLSIGYNSRQCKYRWWDIQKMSEEWHLIFICIWFILRLPKIVIRLWLKTMQVLIIWYSENVSGMAFDFLSKFDLILWLPKIVIGVYFKTMQV